MEEPTSQDLGLALHSDTWVKKVLVSAILATGMVVSGSAIASAATKAPQATSIKKPANTAAEGTATHETVETVATHKTKVKSATKAKTTHKKVSKEK